MNKTATPRTKKEMKDYIKANGFFIPGKVEVNAAIPEGMKDKVPEGAVFFTGLASNGDLNRNGYKIRPDAWTSAIPGYMENPVVLMQHDTDQVIGQCLSAEVTDKGLEVSGYVFDQYTEGRFGNGLYKALSTGHITLEVEFESIADPSVVLTEEEFRALDSMGKYDEYVMCVIGLEWLEFSIVALPSNRKSLITHKNAIMEYMANKEGEEEAPKEGDKEGSDAGDGSAAPGGEPAKGGDEAPASPAPAGGTDVPAEATTTENAEEKETTEKDAGNQSGTAGTAEEKPAAAIPAEGTSTEGAGTSPGESNAFGIEGLSFKEVRDTMQGIVDENAKLLLEREALKAKVAELEAPARRSLATVGSRTPAPVEKAGLEGFLESKGLGKSE